MQNKAGSQDNLDDDDLAPNDSKAPEKTAGEQ